MTVDRGNVFFGLGFGTAVGALVLCIAALFTPWPMPLTLLALLIALFVAVPLGVAAVFFTR